MRILHISKNKTKQKTKPVLEYPCIHKVQLGYKLYPGYLLL